MKIKIRVSVIIPVKNGQEYIERSIVSALNNMSQNDEIIIVDTNKNVIETITFPSINYKDKKAKLLPDLLFAYKPNLNPYAVQSPLLGIIAADTLRNIRPGNHCGGGFLIAAGNKAQEFSKNIVELKDFSEMTAAILEKDSR